MRYAICGTSGREVDAALLCTSGNAQGSTFRCLHCDEAVRYVRQHVCHHDDEQHTRSAHFRHPSERSCLTNKTDTECQELESIAASRISNRMSDFHRQWQSIFPSSCREVRFPTDHKRVHIADVCLGENGDNPLVIEVQHSPILGSDVLSREAAYPDVHWLVDVGPSISSGPDDKGFTFRLEFTELDGHPQRCELVTHPWSSPIPSVVRILLEAWQQQLLPRRPTVYLDPGNSQVYRVLFEGVTKVNFSRLQVCPVSRDHLLSELRGRYGDVEISPWPVASIIGSTLESTHLDLNPVAAVSPSASEFMWMDGDATALPPSSSSYVTNPFPPLCNILHSTAMYSSLIINNAVIAWIVWVRRLVLREGFALPMPSGKHKGDPIYSVPSGYRNDFMLKTTKYYTEYVSKKEEESGNDGGRLWVLLSRLALIDEVLRRGRGASITPSFIEEASVAFEAAEESESKRYLQNEQLPIPRRPAIEHERPIKSISPLPELWFEKQTWWQQQNIMDVQMAMRKHQHSDLVVQEKAKPVCQVKKAPECKAITLPKGQRQITSFFLNHNPIST